MKRDYLRFIILGAIILITTLLVVNHKKWITIDNVYINRIKVSKKGMIIELKDKKYLNKLMDLSVFNGHEHVRSFSEAIAKYGEPSNSISEKGKNEKIEYWYQNARVEIVREETANEEISFTLCSYPFNKSIKDIILDSVIQKNLKINEGKSTIAVKLNKNPLFMVIVVSGKRVEKIFW